MEDLQTGVVLGITCTYRRGTAQTALGDLFLLRPREGNTDPVKPCHRFDTLPAKFPDRLLGAKTLGRFKGIGDMLFDTVTFIEVCERVG